MAGDRHQLSDKDSRSASDKLPRTGSPVTAMAQWVLILELDTHLQKVVWCVRIYVMQNKRGGILPDGDVQKVSSQGYVES